MKRLLIISNNVLSTTNNNGKTILSFINGVQNLEVAQLYFSGEVPKVGPYKYYQISDKDIIKGLLKTEKRGKEVTACPQTDYFDDFSIKKKVGRNTFTLLCREVLWHNKWKSKGLSKWLDQVHPDAIFFVAGDALFAYDICASIYKKYGSRLTVYVTDDYVMPRKDDNHINTIRRNCIRNALRNILKDADCFYTVSESMKLEYREVFRKDSYLAINMTEDMKDTSYKKNEKETIFTYAGSFYYKRFEVLGKLANAIKKYNNGHPNSKAKLMLYSNSEPTEDIKHVLEIDGVSEYGGSLNSEQLRMRLNTSDILVFVESFELEQIEKVKYSLSTKVPEYMSLGKPILAIGPDESGSIKYLKDIAVCVNNEEMIYSTIKELLDNDIMRLRYGNMSRKKYLCLHNSKKLQEEFIANVIGEEKCPLSNG